MLDQFQSEDDCPVKQLLIFTKSATLLILISIKPSTLLILINLESRAV